MFCMFFSFVDFQGTITEIQNRTREHSGTENGFCYETSAKLTNATRPTREHPGTPQPGNTREHHGDRKWAVVMKPQRNSKTQPTPTREHPGTQFYFCNCFLFLQTFVLYVLCLFLSFHVLLRCFYYVMCLSYFVLFCMGL